MIFFLKLMSDLLFYLTVTSGIGVIFGINSLYSLPFFILSAAILSIFAHNKIKYLAVAPLIYLAFISFNMSGQDFLILLPPIIYSVYQIKIVPYSQEIKYKIIFNIYIKASIILFLILLVFRPPLFYIFATFVSLFLIFSIMLLRMLRHDLEVTKNYKLRLFNIISIGSIFLFSAMLTSNFSVNIMANIISFAYFNIFVRTIMFLINIPLFLMSFINTNIEIEYGQEQEIPDMGYTTGDYFREIPPNTWADTLGIFIIIIIACVLIYALIKLFKFLTQKMKEPKLKAKEGERYFLNKEDKPKNLFYKNKIRKTYRKFLKLCIANGIEIKESMTTKETEVKWSNKMGGTEQAQKFRMFYIKNRYGEKELDKVEIKEYNDIYKSLKSKRTAN